MMRIFTFYKRNIGMRTCHLVFSIFGLSFVLGACAPQEDVEPSTALSVVSVQPLSELTVAIQYSAPATALSQDISTLKAELSARINEIPARVGDQVKKGDLLVKLDCSDAQAQYKQARAQYKATQARASMAKQQWDRAKVLRAKKSLSEELLNQREAEYAATQAEQTASDAASEIAKNNQSRCNIVSPFNGIVTVRTGQVGELASPGTPMMTVVSTQGLEVSADIIPSQASSLEKADRILFFASQEYSVSLRALTGVVSNLSRTREARLYFNDTAPLPGTPGRLSWKDSRLGIPPQWLTERAGQLGVMV